ncbi:thyrotroph embryonic factor [Pogonomyrmex barbatus]|uniref:Thyrotroph embryonic factor n=1 Tax=Pogonomyrmex barbatus TaxID=144034 RepID=A0A6I9WL88_9HYME|nr:thyrotroph embryonic factor [Pogonomyrmex barbatus]
MKMENTTNNYTQNNQSPYFILEETDNKYSDSDSILDLSQKNPTDNANQEIAIDLSSRSYGSKKRCVEPNDLDGRPIENIAVSSQYSELDSSKAQTKAVSSPEDIECFNYIETLFKCSSGIMLPSHLNRAQTIVTTPAIHLPYTDTAQTIPKNEINGQTPGTMPIEFPTSTNVILPSSTSTNVILPSSTSTNMILPSSTSTNTILPTLDMVKKASRPFKAYPKDLLSTQDSNKEYVKFRAKVLEKVRKNKSTSNPRMRRVSSSPGLPTSTVDEKDAAYWERRKKNNEAAKRSRDARKLKEDELAIRAAFLEQENRELKTLLAKYVQMVHSLYNH